MTVVWSGRKIREWSITPDFTHFAFFAETSLLEARVGRKGGTEEKGVLSEFLKHFSGSPDQIPT